MDPSNPSDLKPDVSFYGGDLDCGNGLLLLIRRHIDPMNPGQLLEIRSTESSVDHDLPSWCRLTRNELVSWSNVQGQRRFLVCKGLKSEAMERLVKDEIENEDTATAIDLWSSRVDVVIPQTLPAPAPVPALEPLSVMGVGSWPRPKWMLKAIHDHLEGKMSEADFQEIADDAVRLCISAQERADASVITDGEQRRDSFASFVGAILDNTQLIPLADLAAMVEDPKKFEDELRALDVPARDVRHPVVYGKLGRSRPFAVNELEFAKTCTTAPVKIALPGPYLLTRTMWLDCLEELPYASREELAVDVVRVLKEELCFLLASGAALVQFDEPVLSEVVFSGPKQKRSFMCGALSEKGDPGVELDFAVGLMNELICGLPRQRVAVHICRGNWTKNETALLAGDYRPLAPYLKRVEVGTLILELSTPRAREITAVAELNTDHRIGVGSVNPRIERVESVDEIMAHIKQAIDLFGKDRVLLNSDCGFATFADNPMASARIAEAKLAALAEASARLA